MSQADKHKINMETRVKYLEQMTIQKNNFVAPRTMLVPKLYKQAYAQKQDYNSMARRPEHNEKIIEALFFCSLIGNGR